MKRKKSTKAPRKDASVDIPQLYKEDLGTQGVKRVKSSTEPALVGGVASLPLTKKEKKRRKERAERFKDSLSLSSFSDRMTDRIDRPLASDRHGMSSASSSTKSKPIHQQGTFIGQNINLEKIYLRLTTAPRPQDVRPFHILVKALAHVKRRYGTEEDFEYANEQLKAIRQDLTVQRIHSPFVLDVYETHARILLEHGDLGEFNRCQTVLRSLVLGNSIMYLREEDGGIHSSTDSTMAAGNQPLPQDPRSTDEFCGYAILYALVQRTDLMEPIRRAIQQNQSLMGETTTAHAVRVVKAVEHCDYHSFWALYDNAPHMSAFLMDFLLKRVRDVAYRRIVSAYRPNVSVQQLKGVLHYRDLEEVRRFLKQHKAVFVARPGNAPVLVDCKQSAAVL